MCQPDAKDYSRIERSILDRSKGDDAKAMRFAQNMAKAITKRDKAERRATAALDLAKRADRAESCLLIDIATVFTARALEL